MKKSTFQEIYRLLKPGGQFSVSMTTTKEETDNKQWEKLIPMDRLKLLVECLGFEKVHMETSEVPMKFKLNCIERDVDKNPEFK